MLHDKRFFRFLSVLVAAVFTTNTCCYGLAVPPASQNPLVKREVLSALSRTQIRYAESPEAVELLKANNASCLLLSSGKYLVTKEVAKNDLKLLRGIIHEDIEAIMQILAKENQSKYRGIKRLILKYFPPNRGNNLPIDLYVNHTVARAFEWLCLLGDGVIFEDEIPQEERDLIEKIRKVINNNRHNYFTAEFWDSSMRGQKIRTVLNDGIRFYQVSNAPEDLTGDVLKNIATENGFDNKTVKAAEKNLLPGQEFVGTMLEFINKGYFSRYMERITGIQHDPEGRTLYKYVERKKEARWHLKLMNSDEVRAHLLKAFSKVIVDDLSFADKIMKFIVAMRSKLVEQEGPKNRYVDDNLIKALPDIAEALPNWQDFLDALFIELQLYSAVSEEKTIFECDIWCTDNKSLQVIYSVQVIAKPVFSLYRDLFSDTNRLKSFVRLLARNLRENPSLVKELTSEAKLVKYLSELVGTSLADEAAEKSNSFATSYTILELINKGHFSQLTPKKQSTKSPLRRVQAILVETYPSKDGPLVIFDNLIRSKFRDRIFTIEDIIELVGETHYGGRSIDVDSIRADMQKLLRFNHGWMLVERDGGMFLDKVLLNFLEEVESGRYKISEDIKLCPDVEIMVRMRHDPELDSLYLLSDSGVVKENEEWHLKLMEEDEARNCLLRVFSRVKVAEPSLADDIMEFLLLMRSTLIGQFGDKDRCIDDNLIRVLPEIAETLPDGQDFLDALFIELKLFKAVSSEEKTIFEYTSRCMDFGSEFGKSEYKARVLLKPVFSLYKDLFPDTEKLKDFIRSLAKDLRGNPSLAEGLNSEEKLISYLQTKAGKTLPDKVKCLVLDCDGLLWDGIIGEDGIDGIKITPAHITLQKAIKELKEQGIILAINSKNNPEDIGRVLEEHPDMILRKGDFVVIKANWQDKATNIREIAQELNIGIDSLVFLDDTAHEREQVKMACPEVLVPELADNPAERVKVLDGLASSTQRTITDEDKRRTELYQQQRERDRLRQELPTLVDYYRSLEMKVVIREGRQNLQFIPRIAQLTQRTNQFNLTTTRYSEEDIMSFLDNPNYKVFTLEFNDKLGRAGIVGVIITHKKSDKEWETDAFCLSCRVIGRTVEQAFMAHVIGALKRENAELLRGTYKPTPRNKLVEGLYDKLGFRKVGDSASGTEWETQLSYNNLRMPDYIAITHESDSTPGITVGNPRFEITSDERVKRDTELTEVLFFDYLHAALGRDRTYEVRYDASRLSASQIEIVEEYVRTLQAKSSNPDNIRLKPFSSAQGSNESLIAVYCSGKDFKGEGHVDVEIPDGEIEEYLLRLTGMINIALAASNIPDNATQEELTTTYGPIIGFIKNQYKAILGNELAIPDSLRDILKVIRYIVFTIPKAYKMPTEKIDEYSRLAQKALVAL